MYQRPEKDVIIAYMPTGLNVADINHWVLGRLEEFDEMTCRALLLYTPVPGQSLTALVNHICQENDLPFTAYNETKTKRSIVRVTKNTIS